MHETRHNPCATCGACCRSYIVPLCGYDVWLISTRQRLAPEQFLVAFPQDETCPDGFVLSSEEPPYGLALDKQGKFQPQSSCVFLMHLAGGHTRCGIYNDRPVACRAYPMAIWSRTVFQRSDSLCPPDSWPKREVGRPHWRDALQSFHMQMDIYNEVVARWNARVATAPEGARFPLQEYLSYLLNVYDRLERLAAETGEEELANIEASWPTVPRANADFAELRIRSGDNPWLDYLLRARQVIDGFYPAIQPLPLLALVPAYWPESVGKPEEVKRKT
jgi:Fe-S-cluster containining protein